MATFTLCDAGMFGFCGALAWWGLPSVARNLELGRLRKEQVEAPARVASMGDESHG